MRKICSALHRYKPSARRHVQLYMKCSTMSSIFAITMGSKRYREMLHMYTCTVGNTLQYHVRVADQNSEGEY